MKYIRTGEIVAIFVSIAIQGYCDSFAAFENLPLSNISPEGWQKTFLQKQRDGLTGHLDEISEPFNMGGWIASTKDWKPPFYKRDDGKGNEVLCWEPFEQMGYYYDGALRCGLLLNDSFLIDKANEQIYGAIKAAESTGGIIHPDIPDRWPHVCFFRSFMAAYEATGDKKILDGLKAHYANDTWTLAGARNIFNIEQLLWLYQQTGDKAYLTRAKSLYDAQSFRQSDRLVNKFADLISDERQDIHGVTFHEALKLPIMLYMATGETKYLDGARNGFRKLDKFHMLADGIPATEEGLSEKTSVSKHETCDVTDFIWATTYMLKATGEVEWADKIERAALNAGMIVATKDFDAHVYLSSLNQIVCNIGSGTSPIGNPAWEAYAQRQMPWCCTGNLTRFFPIYAGLQWMKGADGSLVKALYGPGSCVYDVNGTRVKLREESVFPFSDTIKITVAEGEASFALKLRIPIWAVNPSVLVNGVSQNGVTAGEFFVVERKFSAGDVITLRFPMNAEVKEWEMNGVIVDYGPLLFALPVPARTEKILLNEHVWNNTPKDSKKLYAYNMMPDGKWKYVLAIDPRNNHMIEVEHRSGVDLNDPWRSENAPVVIKMVGMEMPNWVMHYQEYKPWKEPLRMEPFTPPLPPRGSMTMTPYKCNPPERITLVPYGCTTLRMTVFPYWNTQDIPSFKENQLDYQTNK